MQDPTPRTAITVVAASAAYWCWLGAFWKALDGAVLLGGVLLWLVTILVALAFERFPRALLFESYVLGLIAVAVATVIAGAFGSVVGPGGALIATMVIMVVVAKLWIKRPA